MSLALLEDFPRGSITVTAAGPLAFAAVLFADALAADGLFDSALISVFVASC